MSGPYCEDCCLWVRSPFDPDFGECWDISKIIYDRNGNSINSQPETHFMYNCENLKTDD